MNNPIIWIILVIILAGGGYFLYANQSGAPTEEAMEGEGEMTEHGDDAMTEEGDGAMVEETKPLPPAAAGTKTFVVEGSSFKFAPSVMTVRKGDTVRITLKNTGGFHDLVIDEFDVATPKINGGEEATIEFVADQAGTFEYYCSIGNHRAQGMVGNLIVTE